MKEKKYRFIVYGKNADSNNLKVFDIIDVQRNLSAYEVDKRVNWFIDNGYYQFANYKIEKEDIENEQ